MERVGCSQPCSGSLPLDFPTLSVLLYLQLGGKMHMKNHTTEFSPDVRACAGAYHAAFSLTINLRINKKWFYAT